MRQADQVTRIVVVLVLSLLAGCAAEARALPVVSEALARDAATYAEEASVSLEEAIRRLLLQDPVGELQVVLVEQEPDVFGGLWIQHEPSYQVVVQVTRGERRVFHRYVKGGPLEGVVQMRKVEATLAELELTQAATVAMLREIGSGADTGLNTQENCVALYVADPAALQEKVLAAGATLPDHVCVTPTGPYEVAPALDLPPGLVFPRQDPPEGYLVEMTALSIGRLDDQAGCLRVVGDGGAHLVIWPYDHTVTLEGGGTIAVRDGSGAIVVRVGDIVRMGGGEASSIGSATVLAAAGDCRGPYWIAGRGIEGINLAALSEDPDIMPLLADLAVAGATLGIPVESKAVLLYPEPGIMYELGEAGWLHLHVLPSEQVAEVRAAAIGQDARNAIIDWAAPPSFYRCGRVIALYLGANVEVKETLLSHCVLVAEPG